MSMGENQGQDQGSSENQTGERYVAGEFKAKVESWHYSTAQNKEFIKITMTMKFLEGPNAGKMLPWTGGGSLKSKEFVLKSLKAVGWDGKGLKLGVTKFTKECRATVERSEVPERDEEGNEVKDADGNVKTRPWFRVSFINDIDSPMADKYRVPEDKVEEAENAFNMFLDAEPSSDSTAAKSKPNGYGSGGNKNVQTGDGDTIPF